VSETQLSTLPWTSDSLLASTTLTNTCTLKDYACETLVHCFDEMIQFEWAVRWLGMLWPVQWAASMDTTISQFLRERDMVQGSATIGAMDVLGFISLRRL